MLHYREAGVTRRLLDKGFINAAWVAATHKLTLCYELAADFVDLYHAYGATEPDSRRKSDAYL
jgi:hypothetical protein